MRPGSASTCSGLQPTVLLRTPDIWAEDGASVGDVFGFNGAMFDSFISCHFQKLGVGGVVGHGLGLACRNGILEFALGETFVALANGLDHFHGLLGVHVDVREAATHAVFFSVEDDLFTMRGGDDPISAGVVADCESVCF